MIVIMSRTPDRSEEGTNPSSTQRRTRGVPFLRARTNREAEPEVTARVEAVVPDDDPYAEMFSRVQRGDQRAFAELYDALAPLVVGLVRRVVRDPSQSDEVAQEVFLEIWRQAPRWDPSRGSVRTWVSTVAHRRAVDRVRSEQRARDRLARQTVDTDVQPDEASTAMESTLDRTRVRRALDRLTSTQREAVELAYFGGRTYREVAVLLAVPEGTVKTRIRDGMIRLRDELGTLMGDDR
jgi:RNA polymerase sigma-70 factor, ECF subfamily